MKGQGDGQLVTTLPLCGSLLFLGPSAASRQWPTSLNWRVPARSTRTKSRSATWYMFSILVYNLGCSLLCWKGRWPRCQKVWTHVRAGMLTGHVSITKGVHFWELQYPHLILGNASGLLPQGFLERSNELKHFAHPSTEILNEILKIGWPLTKLSFPGPVFPKMGHTPN